MASSTLTETIEHCHGICEELKLHKRGQQSNGVTNNHSTSIGFIKSNNSGDTKLNNITELTPYDECLRRSKEWRFMKPIRDWERRMGFVTPLIWSHVIVITTLHVVSTLWFIWEVAGLEIKWQSSLFALFMGEFGGFGVTGGAHRFWCHRSYKARRPLQIILLVCFTVAGQNTVIQWVRDHIIHHKFSETSADPHDANRGFFFSHVGWLMMKKHPDVIREGKKIDLSELENDPLVKFHTRYFTLFKILFCFALPTAIPYYAWNESLRIAILSQALVRYTVALNFTWSVNSFAHLMGNKPYDRHIMPSENLAVSIASMGEGWHNYHHTFPWDYKASELGVSYNPTTVILDLFARIGWAYDLKEASSALVAGVAEKRGDGSRVKEKLC